MIVNATLALALIVAVGFGHEWGALAAWFALMLYGMEQARRGA